jgi:hypothetical protein
LSFQAKVQQSRKHQVHLVRCKDVHGRACYYFLQCSKEKLEMILSAAADIAKMDDHAQVIASGFGESPDAAAWQLLKEKYTLTPEDFTA